MMRKRSYLSCRKLNSLDRHLFKGNRKNMWCYRTKLQTTLSIFLAVVSKCNAGSSQPYLCHPRRPRPSPLASESDHRRPADSAARPPSASTSQSGQRCAIIAATQKERKKNTPENRCTSYLTTCSPKDNDTLQRHATIPQVNLISMKLDRDHRISGGR